MLSGSKSRSPPRSQPTTDHPAATRGGSNRLVAQVVGCDLGGLLLFDPLNIRYVTNSTNMQVWSMHNPFRACLVLADGHMVLWDYKHAPFLAAHNPPRGRAPLQAPRSSTR